MKTNLTWQWKKAWATHFMFHFVCNCKDSIENNEVFEPVANLRSRSQWISLIKEMIPEKKISRMKAARNRCNRLDFEHSRAEILREIWQAPYARGRLRRMLMMILAQELDAHMDEAFKRNPYSNKLLELQYLLKLDNTERDILLILSFLSVDLLTIPGFRSRPEAKCEFLACCLDLPVEMIQDALKENGRLRRYGCVDRDYDFNRRLFYFLEGRSGEPLPNEYFTLWRGEVLPWSYFGDMAKEHGPMLKRLISGKKGKPVNILIYGAAGAGKTSFARSLAAELNRACYLVRQNVSGSRSQVESSPESRFGALLNCADHVYPDDCIIVVDEADKMLRGNESSGEYMTGNGFPLGDKCLLNDVLEAYRAPTIWITNSSPSALDATSRRRFDYSIRFEALNDASRLMVWRNNVSKMNMEQLISDDMQKKFSASYPVSAGGIDLVLRNLAGLSPQPEEVEELVGKLMASHCKLTGVPLNGCGQPLTEDYSLEGLNVRGTLPLDKILTSIRNFRTEKGKSSGPPTRMNLLLSGPPGTGKTEFVKFLSHELNARVVVKMGSDLLNMYVGGTEQNIRNAFEKAEEEKAILFLDEIDGLMLSRARAQRSWEMSQVNELLHRMEVFKGIMVGATNFVERLDPAVMRRFTFKMDFGYLDEAGKKLFFERVFGTTLSPEEFQELAAIPDLAPGDFRTVHQSLFYLADEVDNRDRIAALAHESEVKLNNKYAPRGKIGF